MLLTGSLPLCHPSCSLIELSYQQISHQGPSQLTLPERNPEGADKFLAAGRWGKGASLPGGNERYLQPPVKLPSGDDTHAGRHAGAVIRLGCVLCGQLHSTALWLSEPPTGKTVQVTMGREKKTAWDKKHPIG